MSTRVWIAAGLVAALAGSSLGAERTAAADPFDLEAWHADGLLRLTIPLAPDDFQQVSSIGGGVALRAYRGPLEAMLDTTFVSRETRNTSEQLVYRLRALAGYRSYSRINDQRAIVLRALGGVELGGFDNTSSGDWLPEANRPGLAAELGVESRSALDWGGVVTLGISLGASAQLLGDEDAGEAHYLGVELIAGAGIGF